MSPMLLNKIIYLHPYMIVMPIMMFELKAYPPIVTIEINRVPSLRDPDAIEIGRLFPTVQGRQCHRL
jgi:hypothetical protein